MNKANQQAGFTVVELLITLFVAAAFLASGYQLFNMVMKDGGQSRADSRASNVAYDYLRHYSSSTTNPCTVPVPQPKINYAITVSGLSNVTVSVTVSCPYAAVQNISKVESTVKYNSPQQTMKYSTYVKN